MKPRRILTLFLLGLLVYSFAAYWVRSPGYMDADYYFSTAKNLIEGGGLTEPFIWNYLDDPTGIPHPSHLYWMPLSSFLGAFSMSVFGPSFRGAQIVFIFLAAMLPVLTGVLAHHLHGDEELAWQSGLLAILPVYYLPYLVTTDTFTPYAFIGTLALWSTAAAIQNKNLKIWIAVGLLIGLAHLTRADGLLFFVPAALAIRWSERERAKSALLVLIGYTSVMALWWIRNIHISGGILQPGAGRAFWLLTYDELFSYPADMLTSQRWLQSGLGAILQARIEGLWTIFQRLIAENGMVYLGPFMLIGARRLWKQPLVRLTTAYLICLVAVMSLVFPFAGSFGGFFHSSAAMMPVLWVLAIVGLSTTIEWAASKRKWRVMEAKRVFSSASIVFALLVSAGLFFIKAIGPDPGQPRWDGAFQTYQELGDRIKRVDPTPGLIAINNPPGLYVASELNAVVIPNGTEEVLSAVIDRFKVEWVVLDVNRPVGLAGLYERKTSILGFEEVDAMEDQAGYPILVFKLMERGP
jgi:4-amino-4-deoxy-L-arabinose transferase-like glycosyltransferase